MATADGSDYLPIGSGGRTRPLAEAAIRGDASKVAESVAGTESVSSSGSRLEDTQQYVNAEVSASALESPGCSPSQLATTPNHSDGGGS